MALGFTILALGLKWVLETGFLLLALWFMARIQKLQYTIPGLLLCAAMACAFDLIPFVGHYIAVPVLWVSLTKVTREDFTGVAFTAAISYALVFGMNLFLLGALMGDLRPSVRARTLSNRAQQQAVASEDDEDSDSSSATVSEADRSATTSVNTGPAEPKKAPSAPAQPAQSIAPSLDSLPTGNFVLKGITQNGKNSMALVSVGGKTYTLFLNDTVRIQTSAGPKNVRLDKIEKSGAVLDVDGQLVTVKDAPPQ